MKRDPIILDNDTGAEIKAPKVARERAPKPENRRAQKHFRNFVADELQYGMRDFAEDVVEEFGEAIRDGIADAFSIDDKLMRRR